MQWLTKDTHIQIPHMIKVLSSSCPKLFDILKHKLIHTKRKFDASVLEVMKLEIILHILDEELIHRLDSSVQLIDRLAFDAVAGFASIQSVIFFIVYFILIDLFVINN